MEYQLKKLPKSEVELEITISDEKLENYRKLACDEISKDIKIKGFRPGKVPMHILEQYVEKSLIDAHAYDLAIRKAYPEAAQKEKLQVMSPPQIDVKETKPLKFTAKVAVVPEFELPDYNSIKVKKEETKVSDKEVEEVVNDIMKYWTTHKEVDRAAKKGDRVEVDFEGFDENGPVENTKSKHHPVIIGENTLIPGFEDELIGMKKGEEKDFEITFPKDYHKKDFQNKKMKFHVLVHMVEEPTKPELNEEMVKKISPTATTADDLKKEIHENIKNRKETENRKKQEDQYIEELLKKSKVELSEMAIEDEAQQILEEMKENIAQKKQDFQKVLEKANTDEKQLKDKYKTEAERRLKLRLLIPEIIKKEKIEVTDHELKDELEKIKSNYPDTQHQEIENEFNTGQLRLQLANKIIFEKLFEKLLA